MFHIIKNFHSIDFPITDEKRYNPLINPPEAIATLNIETDDCDTFQEAVHVAVTATNEDQITRTILGDTRQQAFVIIYPVQKGLNVEFIEQNNLIIGWKWQTNTGYVLASVKPTGVVLRTFSNINSESLPLDEN